MLRVLDSLLRPVARLLVASGYRFADAAERLKLAYVAAATARAGARATDSRISVMTGLQRRDIARLRAEAEEPRQDAAQPLARVIFVWRTDPRYAGHDLPRSGEEGSFDALVRSLRRDVHPRSVLDELVAVGAVSLQEGDRVRLEQDSFQPAAGSAAQLDYLAANAGDMLGAAVANAGAAGQAPYFERAAHFNRLAPAAVAELDALFRQQQMDLLRKIAARAQHLQQTAPGTCRFRAGGYFYHEDEA